MGAASSAQMKYTDQMPANARTSGVQTHFYGKQKPSSKDGIDAGLQEVYDCWDFPKSTRNVVHILPNWRDTVPFMSVEENWDPRKFDTTFPPQLEAAGISPDQYQQIIHPLNQILNTYHPFQNPNEVQAAVPSCFSASVAEPVPVVPCGEKIYVVEMRKRLRKASDNFPKTQWTLHVHKYAADLAGDLFIETIYHSLEIKVFDQPIAAQDSNSVSTLSPSHGLKLEDVSSKDEASNYPTGKEDGSAAAPSPRPNYGDAES